MQVRIKDRFDGSREMATDRTLNACYCTFESYATNQIFARSSNGRTTNSELVNRGSIPRRASNNGRVFRAVDGGGLLIRSVNATVGSNPTSFTITITCLSHIKLYYPIFDMKCVLCYLFKNT